MSSSLKRIDPPTSLMEVTVDRIRDAIIAGELPLGCKLSEQRLADMLGISRSPVRDALAALQVEGLVTISPKRGSFVFTPDLKAVDEINEHRCILEKASIRKAIADNHAALLKNMAAACTRMAEAARREDALQYTRGDMEFHNSIILSGGMASIGILGSHFAGDFFLGIDIMVTSMMVNFLLMCLTLVTIHRINPALADKISVLRTGSAQIIIGFAGTILLLVFLAVHTLKDLQAEVDAWYFHSTPIWLIVMALGSIIFLIKMKQLRKSGLDTRNIFNNLPQE